ncbi:MAG: outer membrane protein assembly factor BamA [Deltaproteobacteria bacterium]|nr:outer membrane protein assembly factor BamA [Deltaproteobacteria bacterium]
MRRFGIATVLTIAVITSLGWAQERSPKVVVMPFAVQGQPDVTATQGQIGEILVKRLEAEGIQTVDYQTVARSFRAGEAVRTEEQARAAARRFQGDFAVMGTLNQIGGTISLDAKLVDASGRKRTELLFAEERGLENLAAAGNSVVQQMTVYLLSKAVIADIQVRGNDRIESEAVKLNIKSKKGEVLRPEQVREDIKSVYKMGYFEKVETEVTDSPAGKILTFVVQENPTIQEVQIKGSKKVKEKDILAAISTRAFTVLQRNVVAEDVQKIIKLYHQKGYFNVDVTSSIQFPRDPRKASVTFNIKENKKVLIDTINFTGNKTYSARKLRSVMQTKEEHFLLSMFSERGVLQKEILETDLDRLTVFYHDRGFMDARIGAPEIVKREDGFTITIPVDEGERYKVSGVRITGNTIDEPEKLQKALQSKPKEFFSREKLRKDIDTLSRVHMDEGYAHTDVKPAVKQEPSDRTTDITFEVDKKEMVYIGQIYISGNTKTRDKVIRREMRLAEGDVFSATKMEASLNALKKLDFFEEVEVIPSSTDQSGIMNLHVKVKEKLTGSISVGGGFSSDSGAFASGEVIQRNLFGLGQYLGVKAFVAEEAQRYIITFTEPRLLDTYFSVGFDVYNWLKEYNDFTKDAIGFRLKTAYPFGKYSKVLAYYTYEEADVTDVSRTSSIFIRSQEGYNTKGSLTAGVERDSTNHPVMPTKGSISVLSWEFANEALGGEDNFVKGEFRSGTFIPLFWKFVGHVRGQFGQIWELDGKDTVPIYERYFLGGIDSLRGFQWGDVGPRDPATNEVIGGLTYGVVNVELLFPLLEKYGIRGVVFFDAGNAYLDIDDVDLSDVRTDVGAGIRWNSPFGPIRVELGYNLDPRDDEDEYQIQFSGGAFF